MQEENYTIDVNSLSEMELDALYCAVFQHDAIPQFEYCEPLSGDSASVASEQN